MLPYVKINFKNGSIGGADPMDDGVTLMFLSGYTFANEIDCQTYDDFLTQSDNVDAKEVAAFYNEVNGKSRLIVVADDSPTDTEIKELLSKYRGEVRNVVVPNATQQAITNLQNVGEWAANTLFAPVMFVCNLAASYYDENPDVKTLGRNRVAVVDNVVDQNDVPLLYYVAGRLAKSPVQRSLARVKDGAIYATELYTNSTKTVLVDNLYADTKHNLGFITARVYQGKAGYYFSDDLLATSQSDDYALIPRRRTIDKAYRIAYKTLVDYIGDEIPITSNNTIPATICKDIENAVERQIELLMTNNGNLGVDPDNLEDTGVKCYVNPEQDVVSTSKLNVDLLVKPYGYTKYIEVNLGFSTSM